MAFFADLHIHSKYSRATSRNLDFFHLALWAKKKGLRVVGTGDFTHPAWMAAIREELIPAEPGLFRLRDDLEAAVTAQLGPGAAGSNPVRFLLQVEISTIYKQGDKVRKVHHLLYAPDLESAERMVSRLARIGNLASDGRPILGLNSRDLLEICLSGGEGCYLIPAHVWTPWFSVFGSKSGFDRLEECYGDLSSHIFALETGLSSDPLMNWRVSMLDRYRLVSNSDAHSPGNLGREASRFDCDLSYFAIRDALATGQGYLGSVEFFPEEGKYHLDGHRACNFRCEPEESRRLGHRCPVCNGALTLGVHYRVQELADRAEPQPPEGSAPFDSLIPLPEVLGELHQTGAKSKTVQGAYEKTLFRLGPELDILTRLPIDQIRRDGSELLAEAVSRMREGRVIREGGYDGEYGVIRVFEPGELDQRLSVGVLFDLSPDSGPKRGRKKPPASAPAPPAELPPIAESLFASPAPVPLTATGSLLDGLDPDQRCAASVVCGPLLIIAGPGTGKTRTLTHRIAHLISDHGAAAEACLAITFTRRAAAEMRERLIHLLPGGVGERVQVATFHSLGLTILREQEERLGLGAPLRVAGERELLALAKQLPGVAPADAKAFVSRRELRPEAFTQAMRERGLVDFDDLIALPVALLEGDADLAAYYRSRWSHLAIDEYQDVDERQYRLVQLLAKGGASLCAIGDPDQAIYSFRGTDVRFFQQFRSDYPKAKVVQLTRNYRSARGIVEAALQAVAPETLVRDRVLEAQNRDATRVMLRECASERAEAEYIVATIEQLIGGTSLTSFDTGRASGSETRAFAFNDFAILYRTDAQTPALIEALNRSGIPFQKRAHSPLIGQATVESLITGMRLLSSERPLAERLTEAAAQLADTADASLRAIQDALLPLAEKHGRNLDAFLSELALGVDVDLYDPRAERVSLLTLHAAKGLEFRVVFLVGCEDGLLPHRFGGDDDGDLAEERRLFFVGITRAKDRLFLTHARRRHWQGEVRDRMPSPFLRDIQESLLERQREEIVARVRAKQLDLF